MRILIVTHEFPPLNAIGAQRPYSWAKYWSRWGHTVCVLTTVKEPFDGPTDPAFDFNSIPGVRVKAVKYWPFSKPSAPEAELPSSHTPPEPQKASFLTQLKMRVKQLRAQTGMGAVFSVRNLWITPAVKQAIDLHRQDPFDCIVSTYGPPAPHLVASRLKQKLGLPWVADYRDLWFGSHYQDATGLFGWLQKTTEDRAVARADRLTTVSEPLRQTLHQRFKTPTFTVENGFDVEDLPSDRPLPPSSQTPTRLIYTGTIRAGSQVVQPLFKALAELCERQSHLEKQLQVICYGLELGEVPQLIEQYYLSSIVKIEGYVPRQEALKLQQEADGLLFLDWKDTSMDGILTGKIFEYLYSGTPILGIGSYEHLAPGSLLQESGCGICLGQDVPKITNVLEQLISKQALPYQPCPEVLQRYTRSGLAQKMLHILQELTGQP